MYMSVQIIYWYKISLINISGFYIGALSLILVGSIRLPRNQVH